MEDFVDIMCLFYARLRLRGYTETFLGPIFAAAPPYDSRAALMEPKPPTESARSHCLVLDFNVALQRLNIRRLLHEHLHLLPATLQQIPLIVAWRMPRKLGALLVPYRYPRPTKCPRTQLIDDPPPSATTV